MQNFQAVKEWAATVRIAEAVTELQNLKAKYPWVKCDRALETLQSLQGDIPKVIGIVTHQEKQNTILRRVIDVNGWADVSIVEAIQKQYNIKP